MGATMVRLFRSFFASLAVAAMASSAIAAPIVYNPSPFEATGAQFSDVYGAVNTQVQSATTNSTSCNGTSTATCEGLRIQPSYTGLTTAAGALSAAQTVTDGSVAATSQVFCQTTGYAGTGAPVIVDIVPGTGSFAYKVLNAAASGSLNATVALNCTVWN